MITTIKRHFYYNTPSSVIYLNNLGKCSCLPISSSFSPSAHRYAIRISQGNAKKKSISPIQFRIGKHQFSHFLLKYGIPVCRLPPGCSSNPLCSNFKIITSSKIFLFKTRRPLQGSCDNHPHFRCQTIKSGLRFYFPEFPETNQT